MPLTKKAIKAINTPAGRRALMGLFDCTEQTVARYIKINKKGGPLTGTAAVELIQKFFNSKGIVVSQILENENAPAFT